MGLEIKDVATQLNPQAATCGGPITGEHGAAQELFTLYGDRIGLIGAVFFALCVFFFSGVLAPALDKTELDNVIRDKDAKLHLAFEPPKEGMDIPVKAEAVDAWMQVRMVGMPDARDLHHLISRGGAEKLPSGDDVDLTEKGPGRMKQKDFSVNLGAEEEIGEIRYDTSNPYLRISRLTPVMAQFEVIKELPKGIIQPEKIPYSVMGAKSLRRKAEGTITISKVVQQPELAGLAQCSGDPQQDPLELGKIVLQWDQPSVSPPPAAGSEPVKYLVERCEGDPQIPAVAWAALTASPIAGNSFTDAGARSGIEMGHVYHYRVRSVVPKSILLDAKFKDPDPKWLKFGQVTLPSASPSVQVPTGVIFKCENLMTGAEEKKVRVTFWTFDLQSGKWTRQENQKLTIGQPFDVEEKGQFLGATPLEVNAIHPEVRGEGGTIVQPESVYLQHRENKRILGSLELRKPYRILRAPMAAWTDCQLYEGPLPGESGPSDPRSPTSS